MNTNIEYMENAKINALAEQYALEGFSVIKEPLETSLPFDLGGYCPDLIAMKENSGVLVEVKAKLARLPVERFRALAEEVGRHPGWRFLLVTLDDDANSNLAGIAEVVPDWVELNKRILHAQKLLLDGLNEPALLYLWSIFEALLRRRSTEVFIPIERFPVLRLIKHMYSLGEISVSQYDLAITALDIRNKVAHGFLVKVDNSLTNQFLTMIENLLSDWTPRN